jgi:excisionase family DNA binding protein
VTTTIRRLADRPLLVNNVASRLGLSCRTVRHLARKGKLRAYKSGQKIWKFLAKDVEEFQACREARHV